MTPVQIVLRIAALAVLPLLLGALPVPDTSGLAVTPIRLVLGSDAPRGVLTVTNNSPAMARFEIKAYTWDETADGRDVLASAPELVVYPTIFSVGPGGLQTIRVGIAGVDRRATERTYRLTFTQIPLTRMRVAADAAVLGIQTQLSVPVIIDPKGTTGRLSLTAARLTGRTLSFDVKNIGGAYDFIGAMTATAHAADGTRVFVARGTGWYVLAGHDRVFTLRVPNGPCAGVQSALISVASPSGGASASLPVSGSCR